MIDAATLAAVVGSKSDHRLAAGLLNGLGQRFLQDGSTRGVTALKTQEAILNEFLLDSLCGLPALPDSGRVLDIGTGGGVPGLVLAVMRPDLQFVLTDSAQKKTRWVSELVEELSLTNVEVVTRRLEILGRERGYRGRFEAVTAKALAAMNVLVEFAVPFLKVGGRLIAYKGPAVSQEITEASLALRELGAQVRGCSGYRVGDKQTVVCEIVKLGRTSDDYPRRDGIPQKMPLKA